MHAGGSTVDVSAAPGELPLFLRVGPPLPLGAPDVVTLSPASDPGVVSSGKWDGKLRVLWAPQVDDAATTTRRFSLGVPVNLEATGGALTVTGSSGAPLRRLVVEIPLPTAPRRVEVARGAEPSVNLAAETDAAVWSCARCGRYDAGTFALGLSVADGAAPIIIRVVR